jgi:hypothetical protein
VDCLLELDLFKELIVGVLYPLDDEGPKFSPPQYGPFGFNVEINGCFPLPPFSANFGTDSSSFSSPTLVNLYSWASNDGVDNVLQYVREMV